jgi:NAD(P)-dependent dehydrogenase (short-subunit alcohol dehydrogenase family)
MSSEAGPRRRELYGSSRTGSDPPIAEGVAVNTRVVLITGASSGIGLATARAFAKRGARLVLGSRDPQAGEAVIRELGAEMTLFRATDVARAGDMKALVAAALERFGRLDVAVNNAAIEARGSIDSFDEAMYTRVFDANVKGIFFAMEAEIAAMRKTGGGSIINLSSTAGHRGAPGMSIYAASKHAVEGLSKAAALEVARDGIRVNVVAPGPTITPMLHRVTEGHPEALAGRVPLGRAGTAEEQAEAIVWVASPEASFVTGVVLDVNGGISAT